MPFVAVGGHQHGRVIGFEPHDGLVIVDSLDEGQDFVRTRREVYQLSRWAMLDPYSDPREWGFDRPSGERMVHPERRSGLFLVLQSLDAGESARELVALFGETARTSYGYATGVWEWLGRYGERAVWVETTDTPGASAGMYLRVPHLDTLYGVAPLPVVGEAANMQAALDLFRVVISHETATGHPWEETLPDADAAHVLRSLDRARAGMLAEARAAPGQIAVGISAATRRRRAAAAEASAADAVEVAGRGWRARADYAIREADAVLAAHDADPWMGDAASWSPELGWYRKDEG